MDSTDHEPCGPRKRGRKPKNKEEKSSSKKKTQPMSEKEFGIVNVITDESINNESLILHLKINSKLFVNNNDTIFTYHPDIALPTPYEEESNLFEILHEKKEEQEVKEEQKYEIRQEYLTETVTLRIEPQQLPVEVQKRVSYGQEGALTKESYQLLPIIEQMSCHHNNENKQIKIQLNEQSEDKMEGNLMYKTDIHCWWCCHKFDWEPFMLPVEYKNGAFEVVGYFSSPECAAAYLFEQGAKYGDVYKQYSLLHLLYSKNINGEISKIKLALPRETLKIFGGPYTIDEYRRLCDNYYMDVKIIRHPFIPSNGIAEEAMSEFSTKRKFIPLDKDRVQKATEELKLKRSKKKNTENTLEKFINLKIVQT